MRPLLIKVEKINTINVQKAVVGLGQGQHELGRARGLPTFRAQRSHNIGADNVGVRQVKIIS